MLLLLTWSWQENNHVTTLFICFFLPTGCNANRAVLYSVDGRNGLSLDRIEVELTSSAVSRHGNWLYKTKKKVSQDALHFWLKKCFTCISSYFLAIFEFQERHASTCIKKIHPNARKSISWQPGERCMIYFQENSVSCVSSWLCALQFLKTAKTF